MDLGFSERGGSGSRKQGNTASQMLYIGCFIKLPKWAYQNGHIFKASGVVDTVPQKV